MGTTILLVSKQLYSHHEVTGRQVENSIPSHIEDNVYGLDLQK
jgi:hypothetical protein